MENSVATLQKSLPLVPNRNTGKSPVHAQFAPPSGAHVVNMEVYVDTHDHLMKELLSLKMERFPCTPDLSGLVRDDAGPNITRITPKSVGPTIVKKGST